MEYDVKKMIRPKMIQADINVPVDISSRLIEKLVENHKLYLPRYKNLQKYYEGESNILQRPARDNNKPNNKVVSGYPSYIVDLMQGMFVGKPVSYTSVDEEFLKELQDVFNYNDEQDENSELAKMCGIKGRAYEILYVDEDAKIRFNEIDAEEIIVVYDSKINPNMLLAIRPYMIPSILGDTDTEYADVYTKDEIIKYKKEGTGLTEVEREEHYFGQVPVIEFLNNNEGIGDFERVITAIDAYEQSNSDTANDFEEFTDAFLVLAGMSGTTGDDANKLKEDKIILTSEGQSAYWLIKNINDTALENYKNRLNDDIHKFSKVPDVTDTNFASNASGVAMEHKLLALEQVMATKERKFKRGLQKRIELITTFLNIFDKNYTYTDIDISFTRNKPVNVKEAVEIAAMLRGFTSMSTALSELPQVDDVTLEQKKIEMEKSAYPEDNIDLDDIEIDHLADNEMMKILKFISKLPEKDRELAMDTLKDYQDEESR